jgi:hypothetical protein
MNSIKFITFCVLSTFFSHFNYTFSQIEYGHINLKNNINALSIYKNEIIIGFSGTQYTGDVGGKNINGDNKGSHLGVKDINYKSTLYAGNIGFRHKINNYIASQTVLNYGMIGGSDSYATDLVRRNRNIQFKSLIVDIQERVELTLLGISSFERGKIIPNYTQQFYLFSGIGLCYFNPKSKYKGEWVNLKPLRTEGQGIVGSNINEYSSLSTIIPFGFGYRFGVGKKWRVGIEATYVKTFTDYIDDVSGKYFDPNLLDSQTAKYLSNPAYQNTNWFAPGQQRGNSKNKDSYYFLNISFIKNLRIK